MALMVGAMIIQGIQPGPEVMTKKPDLFWGMIASMWIGNLMLVVINLPMIGMWVKLLTVPYRFLAPAILLFCCIGAYSLQNSTFHVHAGRDVRRAGLHLRPAGLRGRTVPAGPGARARRWRSTSGAPCCCRAAIRWCSSQRPISLGLLITTALLLILMALPSIKKAREEAFQEEEADARRSPPMSDLPKRVLIAEEGPREGFQSEKKMIPVADKVRLIEALADTGLRHIACVSYVNPKRVPTMADAEEVASAIRQKPGIEYSALWLNQQGLERALRGPLHVDGGVRVTASDTFSRKNIGKSVPDAMVEQRMSLKTFKDRGMPVEWGIILGAFGCNYEGELSTELILQRVQLALDEAELAGFKLKGIKLTDAMGWATPRSVERLIGAIRNKWPELEIALHLHDTRGTGMATAYAGLRMGVTKFDASIAGLGGCPFAATDGAAGNICTEDFAFMCEEMGVETGLDIDRLIEVARLAEEVVGRPLPGHVMRGGTLTAAKQRRRTRMNAETFIPDSTYVDVALHPVEADALSRHRGQDPDGESRRPACRPC